MPSKQWKLYFSSSATHWPEISAAWNLRVYIRVDRESSRSNPLVWHEERKRGFLTLREEEEISHFPFSHSFFLFLKILFIFYLFIVIIFFINPIVPQPTSSLEVQMVVVPEAAIEANRRLKILRKETSFPRRSCDPQRVRQTHVAFLLSLFFCPDLSTAMECAVGWVSKAWFSVQMNKMKSSGSWNM